MKLASSIYANWSAIVDKIQATPANLVVFYRVDTAIGKIAEVWALPSSVTPEFLVYGNFENQGPATATFTAKYTGGVAVTTSIGVTESS